MGKSVAPETVRQIEDLLREGKVTKKQIAADFHLSSITVYRIQKKMQQREAAETLGIDPRRHRKQSGVFRLESLLPSAQDVRAQAVALSVMAQAAGFNSTLFNSCCESLKLTFEEGCRLAQSAALAGEPTVIYPNEVDDVSAKIHEQLKAKDKVIDEITHEKEVIANDRDNAQKTIVVMAQGVALGKFQALKDLVTTTNFSASSSSTPFST